MIGPGGEALTIGSLFSGIGGLELGLEMCGLGPVVWHAESDPYARAVLAKHWPGVRCYEDVRDIDERSPQVDIICGGFPCTDISNAGKRAGIDGEHSGLWREYARILRVVRPRYVLVENVAALLVRGMERVLGDLAALGFDAEWGVFRASDAGAPHRRARVFILAYADGAEPGGQGAGDVAHPGCVGGRAWRAEPAHREQGRSGPVDDGSADDMAHPDEHGRQSERRDVSEDGRTSSWRDVDRLGGAHSFPPGPDRIAEWNGPPPAVRRGADGTANRVDRLRCLGNAVVPQQAALAWQTLIARTPTKGAA